MPRPPAEPARSARDGRRYAACNSLRQNLSFLAASGAPLVRSRGSAACSLTSDPLGRPDLHDLTFPRPTGSRLYAIRETNGRTAPQRTSLTTATVIVGLKQCRAFVAASVMSAN